MKNNINAIAMCALFALLVSCKDNPNPDSSEIGSSGTTQPENSEVSDTAAAIGSGQDVASGQQRTDGTSGNNGSEPAKARNNKDAAAATDTLDNTKSSNPQGNVKPNTTAADKDASAKR